LNRRGHGGNIRAKIKDIRNAQEQHQPSHNALRVAFRKIRSHSHAGDSPEARANFLNARHQRKRKQHGPKHREAKLRAHLRISRNTAGVVVGRSSNQAGTKNGEEILALSRWRR
jgi:hypothetical protein